MQTMKLVVVATIVALTASSLAQPWEGPFTSLYSTDIVNVIYENENTSGVTIVVGVEVSAQTRTWIYGSDVSLPWTSKFTPKVNQFFTANYGVKSISIPNGYEHVVTHSYNHETGQQQFTRNHEEYVEVENRYREWDTPAPGAIYWVTRPIQ